MFVTSGRARMAYEITGVDDGADVLLIHAGVNDRRSWQHVIERGCGWMDRPPMKVGLAGRRVSCFLT
jgi:hypothetical protein